MGCTMKAIRDDMDHYTYLCSRYGEQVQYEHLEPDCYGKHAEGLRRRAFQDDNRASYTKKYEKLCELYGEEIQFLDGQPDCFGKHAEALRDRQVKDREKEDERRVSETVSLAKLAKAKLTDNEWDAIVWAIRSSKL